MFHLPKYREPDFTQPKFTEAPDASLEEVTIKGVAPENYHSTSMYPEYFKINGKWLLAEESRMDSSVVLGKDGKLHVVENRNLELGDKVIVETARGVEIGVVRRMPRRGSISTAPVLGAPTTKTTTSSSSARAAAVRLPTPGITTASSNY